MAVEEAMWKQFYEKIQDKKVEKKTEHEIRIQELDGGFFERFGTLLKEQVSSTESAKPTEDRVGEDGVGTAGVAQEEPDSSEEETEEEKASIICDVIGLNIEELYSQVLYEILHMVGCDVISSDEQEVLLCYLQEAFKVDQGKHASLLEAARAKGAPSIVLNVEVVEAKELKPKDANGQSDPFCTLFLSSAPTHRYNTSVKTHTLGPTWEEHFSLPIDNGVDDVLCLEVWDFDPAETVREKMTKLSGVKGVKGLRKLMKEIAVTASTGKHDNEIIGTAQIPLKCIPSSGQTMWVTLEKKAKVKSQGNVKVKLAFSSEKHSHVAAQELRHILRLLLLNELENNKANESKRWNGKFGDQAETILRQHMAQSGLGSADDALARWTEFTKVHVNHPLEYSVFAEVLKTLTHPLNNGLLSDDEVKMFWDASKRLLPCCFNSIRKLRKLVPGEKATLSYLSAVLSVLSQLSAMDLPDGADLFPASVYGWLPEREDKTEWTIRDILSEAVSQGANDWFQYLEEQNKPEDDTSEAHLRSTIKIIQLIRTDLQRAVEFHDKIFHQLMQFPYAKTVYIYYEAKVYEMAEPVVTDVCLNLKPLKFNENGINNTDIDKDPLATGTTLFELYLILQRFSVLGLGLCPAETGLHIHTFHLWFRRAVAQWLDIAVYKAMQRIDKAVELDQLVPVDATVKYSSSAVDTLAIYYQIKIFWNQLAWPEVEGSYTFVAKIMDDICRCSVYYADIMSKRVDHMGETQSVYEKKFEVTNEWCLAINNIDYVRQSIHPFVNELGMDEIIKALADFRSPLAAEHCKQTLNLVMDNAIDTVKNKILDLLEIVADKMMPVISRFLLEGAELLNQDSNSVDRLMQYLDDNLLTLHEQLNADNFGRILSIIWDKLSNIMYDLIENSLEKRRPHTFFANLHQTLHILLGFFKNGGGDIVNQNNNNTTLVRMERLLSLHGMETLDLIHQYHLERLNEQREMTAPTMGMLTVRMQFVHDMLRLEVMNARNLPPMDSNDSCDPYVKIHLLPEDKISGLAKFRTKTHKRNLFPLFDETFTIQLTHEQRQLKNGLLYFVVKDEDYMGMSNVFVAEAYVPFDEIPVTTLETGLEEMAQVHLNLSRPSKTDSDVIKALDHRQGEKLARDFIKRYKYKLPAQP